ncbi:MAG: aldo/keto reductase [Anaerolineae bacterium]|nr:aldo/keto reductase [Anaerolineae bacterium]
MRYRLLGNSDLNFSVVGFGTWPISGSGWAGSWGTQDDKESIRTIIAAYEAGINWIDTAPDYGIGHSEEVVGMALRQMKEKPYIATKVGLHWDDGGNRFHSLTRETVMREAENSLRRLGIETIDLYQIHWPMKGDDEQTLQGWEAISRLVEQGKVRYAGLSNCSVDLMQKAQAIHPITSLQPPYNMLQREIEEEILPFCAEHNIGVVCYGTLVKGILTGKYDHETIKNFADDDHRRRVGLFQEPRFSAVLDLVTSLQAIAERNGKSLAQLALAWVLRRNEVTAAIVGARSPIQIQETAQAADWMLSAADAVEIEQYLLENSAALTG